MNQAMPSFSIEKCLPYAQKTLFDIVSDVAAYPEFIPGILETSVEPLTPQLFKSWVRFGNSVFQDQYLCQVDLNPCESIIIKGIEGPFKYLNSQWIFLVCSEKPETIVKFSVEFAFKSKILDYVGRPIFHDLTERMILAFEERVRNLS